MLNFDIYKYIEFGVWAPNGKCSARRVMWVEENKPERKSIQKLGTLKYFAK